MVSLENSHAAQEPFGQITLPLQCQRHGCNEKRVLAFAMLGDFQGARGYLWGKLGST